MSKNYLDTLEIESLNRLTTMFLDFAEDRASRRLETRMADWIAQTDRFLVFNERDVLKGKGRVSHEQMTEIAHTRFEAFDAGRRAAEAIEAEKEAEADMKQLERKPSGSRSENRESREQLRPSRDNLPGRYANAATYRRGRSR